MDAPGRANSNAGTGSRTPLPGKPVRGSRSGRPIMALLDLLGRRWALRMLWELRDGPLGFRSLQARCDAMSPSVLSQRLAELSEAGIVEQGAEQEYRLTTAGQRLLAALGPLNEWAAAWGGGRIDEAQGRRAPEHQVRGARRNGPAARGPGS